MTYRGKRTLLAVEGEYHEISGNIRKYQEISGNIRKYQEISGNIRKYQEMYRMS
jgi:hypothetical protein